METCSICLEKIPSKKMHKTSCGHFFHSECISKWKECSHKCPYCRTPFYQSLCDVCNSWTDGNFTCGICGGFCCVTCFINHKKCPKCG